MRGLSEYLNEGEHLVLPIKKNMESAPNMGKQFGQDVEPSGTYVSYDDTSRQVDGYKYGKVVFNNPLIVDIDDDNAIEYKRTLSKEYKAKKKTLTKKLMQKGYDGLVTKWKDTGEYNEIVLFPNTNYMLA